MNITLWGVRGSIPTTRPDAKQYGGNTSCVEVGAGDWRLILDAGTGIQHVNQGDKKNNNRFDILLTHLHFDHIQGLGFFRPLFDASAEVHIWGPVNNTKSLRARLGRYFSPPLFPVYFSNLTCKLFLHEIENSSFEIGPFLIESSYVIHPGPTIGFRIQNENKVFAYLPDHEPAMGDNGLLKPVNWISGSDLALGANLLLHDAQYTLEEYKDKVGWGHSAMEDALHYASLMNVKRLLLAHHDPLRSDAQLDQLYTFLKEKNLNSFPFEMAVEGQMIEL